MAPDPRTTDTDTESILINLLNPTPITKSTTSNALARTIVPR